MNTLQFLQTILPPKGSYYLVTISKPTLKSKKPKQTIHFAFPTLEELAVGVAELNENPSFDVYHACSSFKVPHLVINGVRAYRIEENRSEAKALWIDLDCGQDKLDTGKGYIDQDTAYKAIKEFCAINNFPAPMIVNSGNGIHCYWPFTSPIPAVKWVKLATIFKQVLAHHKVFADDSVTADFARILRPIGSTHRKGEPKPVVLIEACELIKPSVILERLKALAVEGDIKPEVARSSIKSVNSDLTIPALYIPSYAGEIANHCEQFRNFRDTQGAGSYDMFRHIVGTMSLCEEGIELAYQWSEKRLELGHDQCDVETKFNTWSGGPSLCTSLEKINPQGCAKCPHKGVIITPLVLGRASMPIQATKEIETSIEVVERPPLFLSDKNGNGRPLGTTTNVKTVLEYEGVTSRYNQMTKELEIIVPGVSSVPDESSNSNQTAALDLLTRYGVPYARAPEQINAIAASNPYCPVRQMIESKPWDGIPRFKSVVAQIETPHPQEAAFYIRKWLIQCVAAVYLAAGISAAGILVLAGLQGIGKTLFIRWLASAVPDSFLEGATLDPSNKDSVMTIASHWIVELGELDATFRKADLAQLKAFITKSSDKFRRPYAKKDSEFPRRTVMAGTVNDAEFLYDTTGNRRFWVIQADAIQIDQSIDIQQLWAEAKTWYDAGETWHFNQQEQLLLNQHNSQFEVVDPISEKIQMKFNFQEMVKTTWLTATRVAEIAGIDRPGKSELTRVSSTVKSLNGNQSKRSRGLRLLLVPGAHP